MKNSSKGKRVEKEEDPEYIDTFSKEVVVIEKVDSLRTAEAVAEIYLSYSHDLPSELPKTRDYFEKIIEETESIRVSHKTRDKYNLAFSTVQILNILKPKEWGFDLRKHRNFKDNQMFPKSYNYFDFVLAWEKFLYHQNDKYSHSWFLSPKLSKNLEIDNCPAWFQNWFYYWGPVSEMFPKQVDEVFERFYQTYEALNYNQALLSFCFLYKIPWILQWKYSIDEHTGTGCNRLLRTIKWWKKFDTTSVISDVRVSRFTVPRESSSSSKSKIREALKGLSKEEILNYLKEGSDNLDDIGESMEASGSSNDDPFGGPCVQSE